jgi:DNA repair exonuclease SbcCD ATPase subunit
VKLSFIDITLEDFKSFGAPQTLRLQERGVGLHFMRGQNKDEPRLGSNGSGKSSLWDALSWCLYGRTVGELRNTDIQPWAGSKGTFVGLHIQRDKTKHLITRSMHPNRLLLDEHDVGQEQIDELIGMSFEVFTHTILIGQGRPLFFDLQPRHRMALFSEVLDLDRWDARSSLAADEVKADMQKAAHFEGEITTLEGQQRELSELKANVERSSAEWLSSHRKRQDEADANWKRLVVSVDKIDREYERADLTYDGASAELRALQSEAVKITKELEEANAVVAADHIRLDTIEAQLEEHKAELRQLGSGDACPTCGQPLKGTALAKRRSALQAMVADKAKAVKAGTPKPMQARLQRAQEAGERAVAHIAQFRAKADRARDDLDGLTPRRAQLKADARAAASLVEALRKEVNPHRESTRDITKRLENTKQDIADAKADLITVTTRIERTRFWVKGFKDVRLFVLDEVMQELEWTTNALLEEMGLVGWSIKYDIERETKSGSTSRGLSTLIHSPHSKGAVRWESWSGGEGQRLRLISALALSEVLLTRAGIDPDLEVLDEPTRHLSSEGIRDLCEFLSLRAQEQHKGIWYVDHQSVESAQFTSVLTVVKGKNGSKIVEA